MVIHQNCFSWSSSEAAFYPSLCVPSSHWFCFIANSVAITLFSLNGLVSFNSFWLNHLVCIYQSLSLFNLPDCPWCTASWNILNSILQCSGMVMFSAEKAVSALLPWQYEPIVQMSVWQHLTQSHFLLQPSLFPVLLLFFKFLSHLSIRVCWGETSELRGHPKEWISHLNSAYVASFSCPIIEWKYFFIKEIPPILFFFFND